VTAVDVEFVQVRVELVGPCEVAREVAAAGVVNTPSVGEFAEQPTALHAETVTFALVPFVRPVREAVVIVPAGDNARTPPTNTL
jgi:putative intracellular protease/amidase